MFENDSAVYQLKLLQTVIISWFKTVLQFRFSLYFFTNRRPNPDPFFSLIFAEYAPLICLSVFLSLTKFYFLRTASMQFCFGIYQHQCILNQIFHFIEKIKPSIIGHKIIFHICFPYIFLLFNQSVSTLMTAESRSYDLGLKQILIVSLYLQVVEAQCFQQHLHFQHSKHLVKEEKFKNCFNLN